MKANTLISEPQVSCDELWDDLSAYVDNEIDHSGRLRVECHLADCAECRESVAFMRQADVLLADMPTVVPPSDLRSRILQATIDRQPWWQRLVPAPTGRWAVSGVAIAAIVFAVASNMRPTDESGLAVNHPAIRATGIEPLSTGDSVAAREADSGWIDEDETSTPPDASISSMVPSTIRPSTTSLISTQSMPVTSIARRDVKMSFINPRIGGSNSVVRVPESPNRVEPPTYSEVPDPEMEKAITNEGVKVVENKAEPLVPTPVANVPEATPTMTPRRIILTARLDPGDGGSGATLADLRQNLRQRVDAGKIISADFNAASHIQTLDVYRSRF